MTLLGLKVCPMSRNLCIIPKLHHSWWSTCVLTENWPETKVSWVQILFWLNSLPSYSSQDKMCFLTRDGKCEIYFLCFQTQMLVNWCCVVLLLVGVSLFGFIRVDRILCWILSKDTLTLEDLDKPPTCDLWTSLAPAHRFPWVPLWIHEDPLFHASTHTAAPWQKQL